MAMVYGSASPPTDLPVSSRQNRRMSRILHEGVAFHTVAPYEAVGNSLNFGLTIVSKQTNKASAFRKSPVHVVVGTGFEPTAFGL